MSIKVLCFLGAAFSLIVGCNEFGENKKISREEFERKVIFMTSGQVIESIGRPDSTRMSGGSEYWFYNNVTYDKVTGKVDHRIMIAIENGRVQRVSF